MNQNSTEVPQQCAVCGVQTTQGCSGCKVVFYCTPEHQKLHWVAHKIICRPQTQIQSQVQLKSALKVAHQDDDKEIVKVKVKVKESTEEDQVKNVEILLGFKEALQKSDNFITPKKTRGSSRIKVQKFDKVLTQDQLTLQLQNEHSNLRTQLVQKMAVNDLWEAIQQGKKLIEVSKKLSELGNKAQFYEYIADELIVAKVYIQQDNLVESRELILVAHQQIIAFISQANVYKKGKVQNRTKEQESANQQDNIKICSLLQLMASLFYACGDFRNCESLYVEYVKIIEDSNGQDSMTTSDAYFLVGVFYLQHKRYAQALACFKRSLNIRSYKAIEGKSEPMADCWYNIGVIYKQTGKQMKAIEMINKALEIRREIIGDVSLQVAMCLETLGKIYTLDHDYKSSLTKFSECFYIRRRLYQNSDHIDLIRISLLILNLYKAVKDRMFENFGGFKMQPILKNVIEKIQSTINDNNLQRYIKDGIESSQFESQQVNTKPQMNSIKITKDKDQDQDQDIDKDKYKDQTQIKQGRKIRMTQFNPVVRTDSRTQIDVNNQRAKSQTHLQQNKISSTKTIQQSQDDQFYSQIIEQQEDEMSDIINVHQQLIIRKELFQTLTLDQMILLEDVQKVLRQFITLDKNKQCTLFSQSLSNIQFTILQNDNPWIIQRVQLPVSQNKQNVKHQDFFHSKSLFVNNDLMKESVIKLYQSDNENEDDDQYSLQQKDQKVTESQDEITNTEHTNSHIQINLLNKDPSHTSKQPYQFQQVESERASKASEPRSQSKSFNYIPSEIQSKHAPKQIQGKFRPISILK